MKLIQLFPSILLIGISISALASEADLKTEEAQKTKDAKVLEDTSEPKESALKIVPLITSSPLLGTGIGVAASYLYSADGENSSKSQLKVGGQYSDTESYNIFLNNNAFFRNNSIISSTLASYASVNNEFSESAENVEYNVNSLALSELLLYEAWENLYIGGMIAYKKIINDPTNTAGEDFLTQNGIQDQDAGEFGFVISYDTRKHKYYPSDAAWVTLRLNAAPSWLGAEDDYYYTILNARYYAKGFKAGDVWAWQFYGQYGSDKTPDTGLPTLSGKSLLRGFPAGQFKARYLSGAQTEYRYQIPDTRFRLVAFVGAAYLSGGSYGAGGASRDDDGWYSAGGVGARYAIQPKTGVDLRLDLVTTSENEQSIYVMLSQSF